MNLCIWGAGGHGRVVFDCAAASYSEIAFIDDGDGVCGSEMRGRFVQNPETWLAQNRMSDCSVVIAIGDNRVRAARFESAAAHGFALATVVHPSAVISPFARIGAGTVVMPGAIVNCGASIGRNCIINSGAVVEHDCEIGDHAHISPRAALGGRATVGAYAHVGIGAIVLPGATVGSGAIVGAGAVVLKTVLDGTTVAGVPARPILHI